MALLKRNMIRFKDLSDDTTLFELIIMNNELTKPLYAIMNLINKKQKDKMGYSDMSQRFTELLVEAKISAMAIAGEIIINRMIRKDPDEDFERPDFSLEDIGDYQILSVIKCLENNKSVFVGLSSQNIKKQILSDDFVNKKTGLSYLDPFFRKNTSTRRLHEIHRIIQKRKEKKLDLIR